MAFAGRSSTAQSPPVAGQVRIELEANDDGSFESNYTDTWDGLL